MHDDHFVLTIEGKESDENKMRDALKQSGVVEIRA
jgi:hypothetical protein